MAEGDNHQFKVCGARYAKIFFVAERLSVFSRQESRLRGERPGLPVILATGYAELPPGEKVDVRLLPKPFGLTELTRALKR
jgi:hypothetical protein